MIETRKLSVLFPVKDRVKYLWRSVGSVVDQLPVLAEAGWSIELIAGDNASLADIAGAIGQVDGRVRVIRHAEDLGIFGNTNALLAASSGDWVHVVHDDDWICRGFYARFLAAVTDGPAAGVVSIEARLEREEDRTNTANIPWFDHAGIVAPSRLMSKLYWGNPLAIVGTLIRRDSLAKVGPFREDLPHAADWEMWQRLAAAVPWYWCPELLCRFAVHKGQATCRYWQDGTSVTDIRRVIEGAAKRCPIALWNEYRGGALNFAGHMLRDAGKHLMDDNIELARLTAANAHAVFALFSGGVAA